MTGRCHICGKSGDVEMFAGPWSGHSVYLMHTRCAPTQWKGRQLSLIDELIDLVVIEED